MGNDEKIRIKIDEKSLFYGLYNDYKRGQTATVSTPINQSKYKEKWHYDIISLYDKNIECKNLPAVLLDKCTKNTTSPAKTKIDYFFEFSNIYVDGRKLNTESSFGMYVKREIDEYITNRKGENVKNTHLNRQKLHYPTTLKYTNDGFKVDNKKVLNAILDSNGGFAFVVNGFEIDINDVSINFLTSMVAPKDYPLSQVFKKAKGVGQKLLLKDVDLTSYSIIDAENKEIQEFNISSEDDKQDKSSANVDFGLLNKSKSAHGSKGEKYVFENLEHVLGCKCFNQYHTSLEYNTSPYDMEYDDANGIKHYVEVKATSGSKKNFYMSKYERKFMQKYSDVYILVLVTNVNDAFPKFNKYNSTQISKMRYEYETIKFYP